MKSILKLLLCCSFVLCHCPAIISQTIVRTTDSIQYHLFTSTANTVGYDIFINGHLFIHQSNVPGLPGNDGFGNKADAEAVAGLVKKKILAHILPPTVEVSELDSLHIKYHKR